MKTGSWNSIYGQMSKQFYTFPKRKEKKEKSHLIKRCFHGVKVPRDKNKMFYLVF